jgi:type I restriction-modification system DNA methylase subunit
MRGNGGNAPPERDFRKILASISDYHESRRVFDAFTRLVACAVAMRSREKEYLEEAGRWKKEDLERFSHALGALIAEMELRPFEDILGPYYTEFALSPGTRDKHGEFHTPKAICDLVAQTLIAENKCPEDGPITLCDPACGAGAMILSFAAALPPADRRRLRVTAIDINPTACDMAFINTTLWGIPTKVIHGNSLTMEFQAAWRNIHWLMPWLPLIPEHEVPQLPPQGEPPTPSEKNAIVSSLSQLEWKFG